MCGRYIGFRGRYISIRDRNFRSRGRYNSIRDRYIGFRGRINIGAEVNAY